MKAEENRLILSPRDISSCVMEIMVSSLSLPILGHNLVSCMISEGTVWCKGREVTAPDTDWCQRYSNELREYLCNLLRC